MSAQQTAPASDALRDVMRSVPAGVSVLTSPHPNGLWGMTVATLTSLSLTPPLVMICLHHRSQGLDLVRRNGCFAVNVLGERQADMADFFARSGDHLAGADVAATERDGVPTLDDALAWLVCEHIDTHLHGDHAVVVGKVQYAERVEGEALVRHQGRYRKLDPES